MAVKPIPIHAPQWDDKKRQLNEFWHQYYLSIADSIVGTASGDLSGTYPSPTVVKINGVSLGSTTATSGNVLIGQGSSWVTKTISGDATLANTGALTVTKTNNVAFATSATTDTTNASNISSGTLSNARLTGFSTFTPTVTSSNGADTVPQYTTNTGRYTQLGKLVVVDVYLNGDGGNEGSGTGNIRIALPTTSASDFPTGYFPIGTATNSTNDGYIIYGQIGGSVTTVTLKYQDPTSASIVLTDFTPTLQNNATRTIRLHFSYETA